MKKEFKKLLSMENGYMRINKIAWLHRWNLDALGNKVDKLVITFDSPTGSVSLHAAEIKSRDTEGIAKEIAQHIKVFAEMWARDEANKVLGGHITLTERFGN